jgi:hypothetical protein
VVIGLAALELVEAEPVEAELVEPDELVLAAALVRVEPTLAVLYFASAGS